MTFVFCCQRGGEDLEWDYFFLGRSADLTKQDDVTEEDLKTLWDVGELMHDDGRG